MKKFIERILTFETMESDTEDYFENPQFTRSKSHDEVILFYHFKMLFYFIILKRCFLDTGKTYNISKLALK